MRLTGRFRRSIRQYPWSDFIGMRNVLVHGYIKTNWLTVWNTATMEMDVLEENVRDMQAAFLRPLP